VVGGTAAVERPELVDALSARYPDRVAVGLDAKGREVAVRGWVEGSGIEVARRQLKSDGWKEWTTPYPPAPGAEDPVSAMYAMRALEGDGPWTLQVFSGKKSWALSIEPAERATIDTIFGKDTPVRVVELKTLHEGDVKQRGRFFVTLTDDDRRIPVRAVIKTSIGSIKADLVSYAAPTGE